MASTRKTQRKVGQVLAIVLACALLFPGGGALLAFAQDDENIISPTEEITNETEIDAQVESDAEASEEVIQEAPEQAVEEGTEQTPIIEEATEAAVETEGEEAVEETDEVVNEEPQESEEAIGDDQPIEELVISQEENLVADDQSEEAVGAAPQSEEVTPASELDPGLVKGLEWKLFKAADDQEPDKDKGANPSDYANGLVHYQSTYVEMTFRIDAPGGSGFQENDTISIPFFAGQWTTVNVSNSAEETLYASDGLTELGTWKIVSRNIVITFSSNAEGQSKLENCKIVTAKNIRPTNDKVAEQVTTYSIGGVEHQYKLNALNRQPDTARLTKNTGSSSNDRLVWTLGTGADVLNSIYLSGGESALKVTSVILEDEIPASEGIRDVSFAGVRVSVPFIMSEEDHTAASASGTQIMSQYFGGSSSSMFTEVKQAPSDTYETFKAKVGIFQYGAFKTVDGSFKIVANFGNPWSDSFPLKYSDLWSNLRQSILDADKGVTETEAEIIAHALRDENAVKGNAVHFSIDVIAIYNQAFVDTTKSNTVYLERTLDGNKEEASRSSSGVLKAGSAIATPAAQSATLAKADSVSGLALGGVTFKLKRSDTENGTYADTTYGSNSDGTFVTSSADDNTKGTVNTGTLSPGWYIFEEVAALDGYDLSSASYTPEKFQITGGGAGVIVTATNTPIDYTVHYDTNGATSAAIADKTNVKYWDADLLPSTTPTKPGYTFQGWKLSKRADTALSADDIKNGSAVADTAKYQDLALADTVAHITLQAQWSPKTAATLAPEVSKTVTGTLPATEAFTFNIALDPGTQTNVTMPTDTTATTSAITTGDTTATFDSISFSQAGTYTFKVTEAAGTTNNLSYDNSEIIMTVVVTENDTALVAGTPTFSKAGEDSALAFTNAYAPDPVDAAALDIEKVLTGDTPDVDETFNFELAASDASNPLPTETTLSITGAGTDAFDTWTYTAAGTYTYEVTEQAGTNTAYTYDSTVYTVTDTVTDTAGVLSVDREISNGTNTVGGVLFTNVYTAPTTSDPDPEPQPDPEKPAIVVVKSVDKDEVAPGEELTYTLTVKNSGKGVAGAVRVRDYIPELTTFVSASDEGLYVEEDSPYVEWVLTDIAPHSEKSVSFTVTIAKDSTDQAKVENTAAYDDNSSDADPTPTNTTETIVNNPQTTNPPTTNNPTNTSGTPVKNTQTTGKAAPKTGDTNMLFVVGGLLGLSALGIIGTRIYAGRQRRRQQR